MGSSERSGLGAAFFNCCFSLRVSSLHLSFRYSRCCGKASQPIPVMIPIEVLFGLVAVYRIPYFVFVLLVCSLQDTLRLAFIRRTAVVPSWQRYRLEVRGP